MWWRINLIKLKHTLKIITEKYYFLWLAYLFLIVYFRVDMDDNYDIARNSYLIEDNDDKTDNEVVTSDKASLDTTDFVYPF